MRYIYPVLLILLISSGCVSSRQFKELELQKAQLQRMSDSLLALSANQAGELGNLRLSHEQLTADVVGLRSDTNATGNQLRRLHHEIQEAMSQNQMLEENYRKLLKGRESETTEMMNQLRDARTQLLQREDSVLALEKALKAKIARLTELEEILARRDREMQALRTTVAKALKSYEGAGLTVQVRNGKVYVSLSEKLLFASGSTGVAENGKKALTQLGQALNADTTLQILVEGHTDDVPMKPAINLQDNWDLSVLRATSIVRILIKDGGVQKTRITASGKGEYSPVAPNDSPENKAKNRRTEIILSPKLDVLYDLVK
jgi:chemotaxis protein MotB